LEGKGREGKAKKEETSGKINKFGREGVWRVNFSSKHKNPPIWRNSKIVLDEGLEGIWRVYMNSSNLINVVIIFLNS
jgi:hypothetical protein